MTAGTDAPATDAPSTDTPTPETQPKPTDTVEFWKAQARENEKRAKANADAATRLAALEESQKTEAQKLADAKAAAEKDAADARADALRWRIAAKHQISDEDAELFLTGTDEVTLTKQAERLAGRVADQKKTGNRAPNEGKSPPSAGTDPVRELARNLFGSSDS
jgi:membrane protein involved in colicin uptake